MKTVTKKMPQIVNSRGDKQDRYYISSNRTHCLGWSIMDRADKNGEILKRHRELFYHTSEDVVQTAFDDLLEGNTLNASNYPKLGELKPMIIVFNEKHGDAHYIYTSREEFYQIFLSVLIERKEQGWYEWYSPEKPKNKPKLTLEEINALDDQELKEFEMKRFKKYEGEWKEYEEALTLKKSIKDAVDNKDGKLAYLVLNELKSGEYEGFEVITPIRVNDED